MARGTTLSRLLDMLRATAKTSLNPAHNQQIRDSQVLALQATQEWLWDDFNWPHLRVERTFAAQNGERFYSVPTGIHIDRIQDIQFRYGNRWTRLSAGIDIEQYRQWDSDADMRSWPVTRWRIYEDEQIEVWPIPSLDGTADDLEGYIKVVGIRNLKPLVADDDVCDLDDRMLVDFTAAELLASADEKRAATILSRATKRYAKLRGELMPRKQFKIGQSDDMNTKKLLRGPPRVQYRIVS